MTPATLEALAQALARLEPAVFQLADRDGVFALYCEDKTQHLDNLICRLRTGEVDTDDDRLFGTIWRCAVARGLQPAVEYYYDYVEALVRRNGQCLAKVEEGTPGVALALAYCAALGEKVSL